MKHNKNILIQLHFFINKYGQINIKRAPFIMNIKKFYRFTILEIF